MWSWFCRQNSKVQVNWKLNSWYLYLLYPSYYSGRNRFSHFMQLEISEDSVLARPSARVECQNLECCACLVHVNHSVCHFHSYVESKYSHVSYWNVVSLSLAVRSVWICAYLLHICHYPSQFLTLLAVPDVCLSITHWYFIEAVQWINLVFATEVTLSLS